jgi:hypothetical protein
MNACGSGEGTVHSKLLNRGAALLAGACVSLLAATGDAGAQSANVVEKFTATSVGVDPGAGQTITVDVLRWSTDDEAQKLLAAFKDKGDRRWVDALQSSPSLGYVWTSGENLGYTVRYARRFASPDGAERVVIATEPRLGSWERPAWKAAVTAVEYPFSVIELRVNRAGDGDGKASLAAKVVVDGATQSLALENYRAAPVLLKAVKRIKR